MATKHYSAEDFQRIPVLGLRLENLAADPAAGQPGDIYFNTALGYPKVCLSATGPVWAKAAATGIVDSEIGAGAAIALSKLAINPVARANHTGTQVAATISDFDTQVRTSRLDQMTTPTAAVSMGGQRITNGADPQAGTDFTTQQWVQNLLDARVNGQDWKASARLVANTNVNVASAPASIDGTAPANGDRILLVGQTTPSQNGLYQYNGSGSALTRSTDADASAEVTAGMTVPVAEGTTFADTIWLLTTNDAVVLGTTGLTFTQVGGPGTYAAGNGLQLVGNTFSLVAPVTVANGGTGASTAAAARTSLNAAQKGFSSLVGALTAGVGVQLAHGLATAFVTLDVIEVATGNSIRIDTAVDAANITITSAINVAANALRVNAAPVV